MSLCNRLLLALTAVSTLGATACVVDSTRQPYYGTGGQVYAQGYVQVGPPAGGIMYTSNLPPDPLYEERPAPTSYGYVWIDGCWNWNGGEWQWASGRWEPPREGYVYIQPYYDEVDGRYLYTPGYWETPARVPPRVVLRDYGDGRPRSGTWQTNYHYTVPSRTGGRYTGPPQRPGTVTVHDHTTPAPVMQPAPVNRPGYNPPPPRPPVTVHDHTTQPPPLYTPPPSYVPPERTPPPVTAPPPPPPNRTPPPVYAPTPREPPTRMGPSGPPVQNGVDGSPRPAGGGVVRQNPPQRVPPPPPPEKQKDKDPNVHDHTK